MTKTNPRARRRLVALLVAILSAVSVGVLAPGLASPASAVVGYSCWNGSWPQFPPGSVYVTSIGSPFNACNNGPADPATGVHGVTYITPGDLNEGTVVCWAWTNKITGGSGGNSLPAPWAYREGFVSPLQCAAGIDANGQRIGVLNSGRVVHCPSCPHNDDRLDLRMYWNPGRGDNLTTTDPNIGQGYTQFDTAGKAYRGQVSGTVALRQFWNPEREDNITTTWVEVGQGYSFVGIVGYVYPSQQAGTCPLRLFWSPERGDNFTTTYAEVGQGYSFVEVLGYALC
jgi:hypothetical protein